MIVVIHQAEVVNGPDASEQFSLAISTPGAMASVGETIREFIDLCFEWQTDPWGNLWVPLSETTLRIRAARGKTGKILQVDGYLRRSIAVQQTADPAVVYVIAGGPAAAYAGSQQWGNPSNKVFGRPGRGMVARPFFPLTGDPGSPTPAIPDALMAEMKAVLLDAMKARLATIRGA